jgi:hypothetical protein
MRNGAPSSAASRATATTMAAIESRGAGSRRLAEVVRLLRSGNESWKMHKPAYSLIVKSESAFGGQTGRYLLTSRLTGFGP